MGELMPIAEKYEVHFINFHETFEPPLEISFVAHTEHDVRGIIEALSTHYSGDPYECFINGQKTVLEKDWGLL